MKPNKGEAKQDFLKRCAGELVANEGQAPDQAYAVCNHYWDDGQSQRQALTLTAPLEFLQKEDADPGFFITAYTGAVVDRFWGKMVIDVDGIKTKSKFPVLREHERDRVIGYAVKSWKEGKNLLVMGDFSKKTRDSEEVQALADEGFPWQASIGVWPKKVMVLNKGDKAMINGQEMTGPMDVWVESEVKEVSFVAIGADDNTAAISFSDGPVVKVQIDRGNPEIIKEEHIMALSLEVLSKDAPELLKEIREAARQEGFTAGVKEERGRVVEILGAGGDQATTHKAIADGVAAAETFKLLYLAEKDKQAAALKEMETSATPPMGQVPVTPAPVEVKNPDLELSQLATQRAREKGIEFEKAMLEIASENPALMAAWNPATGLNG